jgi:radical SAM protein (TIGR01212 family)
MTPLYNEFAHFLKRHFPYKVQKISLNVGFTCPNRDGTKGRGGCTYCNNRTFNPDYCRTDRSVALQLEEGKQFFAHKYPDMKYLAYFQAYTNTYDATEQLKRKYEEALAVPDVVGLVIATRPDCVSDDLLDYLALLSRRTFVLLEYGIETADEATLLRINRRHTYRDTVDAITRTARRGIPTGGHIILGLPGETRDSLVAQAAVLSRLPLTTLKIHQLQVIRGTRMADEYHRHPEDFGFLQLDAYLDLLVDYLEHLRPDLVLERFVSQSPRELLLAPDWRLKNHEFTAVLRKRMTQLGAYQGKKYGR